MKYLVLFIFLTTTYTARAQKIQHYYDWRWEPIEPASARFYEEVEMKDSAWKRIVYYLRERSQKMSGNYRDSSCTIPNGKFRYYHPNGIADSVGEYRDGKKEGLWLAFHSNGMIADSAMYINGNKVGTAFRWHKNGYIADSSVISEDGSGVSVTWFDNGLPSSAGRFSAGHQMHGKWKFFHKNGNLSAVEVYDNGKAVDNQYFDEDGKLQPDAIVIDRQASFTGGAEGWKKFITKQVYFPSQYRIVNADKAVVVVQGVVDEDGKMTDVEVYNPFEPTFDKIAVNAVRNSPKWTPAVQHNRKVKYKIRQVVTFSQE